VLFTLRDYHPADFQRLWQIDQLCFPPGIAFTQMDLTGFVSRRNAITLVAEFASPADGADPRATIAGFVVAQPGRKIGRVLTLDIVPEARRSGLGFRLLQECERRLRARGCSQVYLETAVNNEAAVKLYQKLGYNTLRVLPDYYPSHSLDALLMGKHL
jgi:ribosomal-protein-alanine N-acetyltransferase